MKSLPRLALLCCMLAALVITTHTSAQSSSPEAPYVADELLVELKPGFGLSTAGVLLAAGGQPDGKIHPLARFSRALGSRGRQFVLQLQPGSDVEGLVAVLGKHPAVSNVGLNYIVHGFRVSSDTLLHEQWALPKIRALEAWDITTGGDVVIAMLDTGVSVRHQEFWGKLLPGFNAVSGGGNTDDNNIIITKEGTFGHHGTHTAGVAASTSDNGSGIAGVCWGCRILPVKVLDRHGQGNLESLINGIEFAANSGARIISMSLGFYNPKESAKKFVRDAVDYAYSKGSLIIAAAGNEAMVGNPISYPAAYDHVLAVGASTPNDQRARFSSYGFYVDVLAPGVGITSTVSLKQDHDYIGYDGTSMATPHVSGLAGLILTLWPELTPDQLTQLIVATADDLGPQGRDDEYGYGRINALRAVEAARDRRLPRIRGQKNPAFAPVGPSSDPAVLYFPETQHTLRGGFKDYWQQNGGLPVFGFPISEEFLEDTPSGQFVVQYFERERLELHLENPPPYHILLGRLGDTVLLDLGRNWFTFPKSEPRDGCRHFFETGHSICEPFLSYWRNHGLSFDSNPGFSETESLALFGVPLSEPMLETNLSGDTVITQWFERARFEHHPNSPPELQVKLGLLGNESVDLAGWR